MSVWLLRGALLHLMAGFTLGALLLVSKATGRVPDIWRWLPVHAEILLVGWCVQLVMGVAYWIFPRFGMSRRARGREALAWLALVLVNAGVALMTYGRLAGVAPVMVAGRAGEVAAAAAMAVNIWSRTRASGISPM